MKCYYHPERDGVAVCKACGRGVCLECAKESEETVACQQSCIDSLKKRTDLFSRQAAHLKNMKRISILGSFFSIGMGILFIYFSYQGYGLVYEFIFVLGIGFTVYGVVAQLANFFTFYISRNKRRNN
jgi:hypothetical protein